MPFVFLGWLGYSNEKIVELAQKYLDLGFTTFKMKVGQNLQDDIKRLEIVRNVIGWDKTLVSKNYLLSPGSLYIFKIKSVKRNVF